MRTSAQQGYILLLSLVFLGIFVTTSTALLSFFSENVRSARHGVEVSQARSIAEAGLDQAVYQLNQSSSYTGETGTAVSGGVFTTSVATIDSSTKSITSTGYVPSIAHPLSTVTVKAKVSISDAAISFRYGVQAGAGGFSLTGGSTINGSVYANGDISATTGVHITGSATAANPPALAADQVNATPVPISSCTSSTCITFGNASASQDFAQSFKLSSATALDSVQFYIKKVSTPSDATVRIVADNGGSPDSTTILSGTLSASSVTTNFGWVTVTLPSTPVLDPSQTYWIVIDAGTNSSKYYIIGANSSYANGTAKVGQSGGSWNATSPAGLDGYFQIFLGGGTSMIGGNSYTTGVYVGTTGSDNAYAHTVTGATVFGTIYCQTSTYTNKSCNTTQADPTPQALPLSDSNIQDWKDDATTGGTITGDYHVGYAGATLGPKIITGDLTVDGGGILIVSGTLWVKGNISVSGGGRVQLASSYGANDGAIVTDGYVSLTGGSTFAGSGTTGSYPFVITTSACPADYGCSGNDAIYLSGGSGTVALVAQNGTIHISGGAALKAATAAQIVMDSGATLYYDSGLISANFASGPGGSWAFVPGSYGLVQ
jgi:hypothetical protein